MSRYISRRTFVEAASLAAAWSAIGGPALAAVGQSSSGPSQRVRGLLARMTVEEKIGQLSTMPPAEPEATIAAFNPARPSQAMSQQLAEVRAGRLGCIFNNGSTKIARELQKAAVKGSRLKVPVLFGADVIHGFKTVFPVPLGEAASFDPLLCERTARAAAVEATSIGLDWTFAPMVDISRDARWGRGVEGAGEDVLLGRLLAAARVRGFQGRLLSDADAMLACPKHFAAYGAAESGVDYNTVDMSERTLREVYLPPFKAAFDAGALSTMASFNEINGVPSTGNPLLLDRILRGEWGFEGFVVSDYTGDLELVAHGFAADEREAVRLAFLSGVDMSMASGLYSKHLPALVASKEVPIERLDQAVLRILTVKERLGLFDDPFRRLDADRRPSPIGRPEHLELAREAGRKSIVLLKNENDLLPLPNAGKKIALIGPFAEGQEDLLGPWALFGSEDAAVNLATGIRAALADASQLTVVRGCTATKRLDGGIEKAVAAAKAADVVLLALGETDMMSGESHSRANIVVPDVQVELAEAVAATGKPIVILLRNGRPLALDGTILAAPAILVTWFLGSQTGHAIADVVFGRHSPSGRLPMSFPRVSGQSPYYYARKSTGRPSESDPLARFKTHFMDTPHSALFPFGHGLTFGSVEYGSLEIEQPRIQTGATLGVAATVTNRGPRAAEELVQLYVQDVAASITRPVRELKAFQKVMLAPGASERVKFTLTTDELKFLGNDLREHLESGRFKVWVAPSAEAEGVSGIFDLEA